MTQIELMKQVLWESDMFLQSEIEQLFVDAHVGRSIRHSDEDDELEQEEEEEDETIPQELSLFVAQQEAFERATDDGRCLRCEGWGCDHCNHTGGY